MLGSNSCKRLQLLIPSCRIVRGSVAHLHFFQKEPIFIRSFSSKSLLVAEKDEPHEQGAFTASYLMNSCGLSPELALSVSKRVHIKTREGPDLVLNLLKDRGFSETHISEVVKKRPKLLLVNPEKTLLPKLEFFSSVGLSGAGLARVICGNPEIVMKQSLEKSIIPCYHIIKSLHLLDTEKVALFFRSLKRVGKAKVLSNTTPNIAVLRAVEVPEASIPSWVANYPSAVSIETEKFKENVKKVMSMGVLSSSATFMKALHVITLVDASEWAQKMELYKKWGWTEDDFLLAFRKNPLFMNFSEKTFFE